MSKPRRSIVTQETYQTRVDPGDVNILIEALITERRDAENYDAGPATWWVEDGVLVISRPGTQGVVCNDPEMRLN